ncbi:MAG TPA: NAD(P)/FAD-dependent oxidoreductase [Actinomycetes bacterium]|nr:NAD(P)/FAD-dependent oxidoreductase [Actinomycetes bacterium]
MTKLRNRNGSPRVVVVGGGFAGLNAVKSLAKIKPPVRTTLLEQHNYHLFQPLLYQLATGVVQPADIAHPVRGIVRRHRRAGVRMATVSGVDLDAREVLTEEGGRFPYDYLVLAAGAITATFGIPGVEEHGFPLKSMPDALRLRAHLLHQFELADNDPAQIEKGALTVVVGGGGPTGVEMAGALHELFKHVLVHDFPDLDINQAKVVLLEAMDHLLAPFHPSSRQHALEILRKRDVEVRLGQALERATADEVVLKDGTVIPTRTLVWGAGVRAHPLADVLGLEQTRGGRIVVGEDLSVPGRPEVFVVGDLAGAGDGKGGLLPQVAQPAIQEARHAAQNIQRTLKGEPRTGFEYKDKGIMATIGRNAAVTELPSGARFKGVLAWYMWLALHLAYIIGFRSRVAVLVNWIWSYLTYDRHARIIVAVEPQRRPALVPPPARPAAAPAEDRPVVG